MLTPPPPPPPHVSHPNSFVSRPFVKDCFFLDPSLDQGAPGGDAEAQAAEMLSEFSEVDRNVSRVGDDHEDRIVDVTDEVQQT